MIGKNAEEKVVSWMQDIERVRQVRAEGLCCAQTLVQLGLDWRGEENEQLIAAVAGLCGGIKTGNNCGALTGAACMLSLFGPDVLKESAPRLVEWFEAAYGTVDCAALLEGKEDQKSEVCRDIIESTYLKTKELLLESGFEQGGILAGK